MSRRKRFDKLERDRPRQYEPVDTRPGRDSIMATTEAHHAGRPYSMSPSRSAEPTPAGQRIMARLRLMRTNSERAERDQDNSVERRIDSDDVEYVMRRIRENYVTGSSC